MDTILNCIIVEDEPIHSNRLKKLLTAIDERVKILAICTTIEEAVEKITRLNPQLVFLDIQLQDEIRGGFEVIRHFKHPGFDVLFTTAHIDNNILEIRRCGLGYLAKPYVQQELEDNLRKVWEKQVGQVGVRQLETLLHNLITEQLDEQLIWVNLAEGSIPVKIKNLVYGKAIDQYTALYVLEEEGSHKIEKLTTSKGIGVWAEHLAPLKFCRSHDSYIINLRHIARINKSMTVTLRHVAEPLPLSRTGKERLNALIKNTSPLHFR
ncbi:LytR/AlgR family response regulator transcription factor [Paraflavitalea pollutisoli]|uniref:LytR/AlgR family response regulator transcription factor n=1 Tax=Paraflavitalea pollutisoli TaxID=3034143 RepID=UPI0023EE1CF3|nr:LytTR family DNA-binding domain-containing protein [Paraflavitalea sp. H1-2-19X]